MGTILYAWLVPHFPLILHWIYQTLHAGTSATVSGDVDGIFFISTPLRWILILIAVLMVIYHFYSTIRLHIAPLSIRHLPSPIPFGYGGNHKNESGSFRVGVQYGGMFLIRIGVWGGWIQLVHYLLFYVWLPKEMSPFLLRYLSRASKDEYFIYVQRNLSASARQASQECATKYPLIMVHGIGFRDLKYFNYWGRVPRYLTANGATVYYGHQKA